MGWIHMLNERCHTPAGNGPANRRRRFTAPDPPTRGFPATFLSVLFFVVLGLVSGCAVSPEPVLQPTDSYRQPDFRDDLQYAGLEESLARSVEYLKKIPADRPFQFGDDAYPAAHLLRSLEVFADFIRTHPDPANLNRFISENFQVYQAAGQGPQRQVLYTGYYEPLLRGRSAPDARFNVPVLGRPDNLVKIDLGAFSAQYGDKVLTGRLTPEGTVVPFFERREIEETDALNGRAPVLTWMESEVDLFFLQIQGSGRVILEDGRILHVHYDSTNGQPYRSIGKLLIDENKIPLEEMSMQKIRSYLEAHPEDLRRVLNYNPSYVFFKLEEDGPLGCLNVKLTPGRSIALDRRIFPLPVLAYVETEKPLIDGSGNIVGWQRFGRFAVSQDTGGAIKGPARADLYWGSGTYAEIAAGHMRHRGPLYMLVLKPGREQTAEVAANAVSSAGHPAVR